MPQTEATAIQLIDAEAEIAPPPPPTPVHGAHGRLLLGASLVLVSLNLRGAITSIGPVLREIIRDAGLCAAAASTLTTLPSLCFGLAAPLAPCRAPDRHRAHLARDGYLADGRYCASGPRRRARSLCRPDSRDPRHRRDQRFAARSGETRFRGPGTPDDRPLHDGTLRGRGGGGGATVPLMAAFGGSWSAALAFWALPAAARRGSVWATRLPPRDPAVVHTATRVRGLWADPLAWHVMLFMGLQSALAYTVIGWLPPMLRDRGLSPVDAGLVLSISVLVQASTCLFAPALATRGKDQSSRTC